MTNERSLRVALGLLGDAMNHGPSEPVFALIAEARDTIESVLQAEPEGSLEEMMRGLLSDWRAELGQLESGELGGESDVHELFATQLGDCIEELEELMPPQNRPASHE